MADARRATIALGTVVLAFFLSATPAPAPAQAPTPAPARTSWSWSYSGSGISAAGSLLTSDTPDAAGYFHIVSITGSRNGDAIVALYPTGLAIPGNEPYSVDNLIRRDGSGMITVHGFGYSLASGAYVNPYFADFLSPPAYAEVFTQGGTLSEVPITFTATPVAAPSAVPEPSAAACLLSGFALAGVRRLARRRDG